MKSRNQKQSNCCPVCKASILHFEGDQFCVDCDWSTMLADVQSGRFERRLGLKKPAKSQMQPPPIVDATATHTKSDDETAVSASAS